VFGGAVFGKAKTGTQAWFKWDAVAGWGPVTGEIDATVLN
jgi:hypothetical protein